MLGERHVRPDHRLSLLPQRRARAAARRVPRAGPAPAPDGVLVFNNHKNRDSLRRRIVRLIGRKVATRGTMSRTEVEALVAEPDCGVVEHIPLAILPVSETAAPCCPLRWWSRSSGG